MVHTPEQRNKTKSFKNHIKKLPVTYGSPKGVPRHANKIAHTAQAEQFGLNL